MKVSVFYDHVVVAHEQTGLALKDILVRVKNAGIDAVDCEDSHIQNDPEGIKELFREVGLEVASLYGYFDLTKDFDFESAKSIIDDAVEMQADKVMIIPGSIEDMHSDEGKEAMQNIVGALNKLCDYAKSKNVALTLESFDDPKAPGASDKEILWFIEQVPDLKCTFEVGNFCFKDTDEVKALEELKDYIIHVHANDRSLTPHYGNAPRVYVDGKPLYSSPVGQGITKMEEIIERLKALNYDGYISIEHFGSPDELSYIEQSAEWLLAHI